MRAAQPNLPAQSGSWHGQSGPSSAHSSPQQPASERRVGRTTIVTGAVTLVLVAGAVVVAGAAVFGYSAGTEGQDGSTVQRSRPTGSAYEVLQAESAGWTGRSFSTSTYQGTAYAGPLMAGHVLRFDQVDFGPLPATAVTARFRTSVPPSANATISVRLGNSHGEKVGQITVADAGNDQMWTTTTVKLERKVSGKQAVYLVISSGVGGEALQLDWVQFHH
ncbi:carbohydrate-binding protein [Saccharopolyspora karakumensis]|uniref:Carbohydrate-binding protein n=2 Tax=Saccharopolyspora karakumensis TaxID=2530386 RepID=A0A4R5BD42_9PSEU|nr:carbohydrate-binding protein [Saccharopolyspora karakumensis]